MIQNGGNLDGLGAILAVTHLPALLLLLALGLWHARQRPARLDLPVALLAAGLALGFVARLFGIRVPEVTPAFLTLITGVLVVIDSPRLSALQPALFLAGGLSITLSSAGNIAAPQAVLAVISLSMLPVALSFYFSLLPQHPALSIGRRVMGSWILAVSLLIAAFHLKSLGG